MKKMIFSLMLSALILTAGLIGGGSLQAASLYEFYADATADQLNQETTAMGRELKKTFSQQSIARNQQKIDFAAYFANLKKAVLYARKLATYSQYQEDLSFARDNELFKGLPDDSRIHDAERQAQARREFVEEKYERTRRNVEEEIDSYVDLLNISLDTCEAMSNNDLSDFMQQEEFRRRVKKWFASDDFSAYRQTATELERSWPDLEKRITAQCRLWQGRPAKPSAPIISAGLVDQL